MRDNRRSVHPLLLEPTYWRVRLQALEDEQTGPLITPRPDLSGNGRAVVEFRIRAHDGERLWGLLSRPEHVTGPLPARIRSVGPADPVLPTGGAGTPLRPGEGSHGEGSRADGTGSRTSCALPPAALPHGSRERWSTVSDSAVSDASVSDTSNHETAEANHDTHCPDTPFEPASLHPSAPAPSPATSSSEVAEFVFQEPAGRRLEDRVLDVVRICRVAGSTAGVDGNRVELSHDACVPDEFLIVEHLKRSHFC